MAQVPLRMAQPGLVPPHQQRPPMMVSMTQPPPVSMQGLVSMAPMMGPGGGMALMTQAMNHPESGHEHHTMNGPFHHHHHHHHHHAHHPPHGAAPRPHGPSQGHPVPPPPHPSGPPQPPHSAPPHSQYHPHPAAPHHVPHSHHNGPHSVHHSSPHSASHSHSGPPPPPHMTSHTNSSNSNTHSTHGHPQSHLQSGPPHMNQPGHSIPHHSPHQMSGMSTGTLSSNQHHTQQQHHHSQHPHHQPMHQQMQHSQLPQQPPPPQPPQQHLQHQVLSQPPQHQVPHSAENPKLAGGMIVLSNNTEPSCTTMNMVNTLNATPSSGTGANAVVNGIVNRNSSTVNLNTVETTITSSSCSSSLVSTREKTPMCLINELARYNKISHQYCLTDEKGPAHKKIFTVTLKLGDSEEEYSASGPSIKKAQHSAAALSLEKTKFKHPPPKTPKQNKQTKLTPTVELNALAMKRGEAAVYTFIEPPRPPNPYAYNVPPNLRGVYSQKFYGRPPVYPMFFVSLRVGNRDFGGEGATAQQAKHNAASKALKVIKSLPMPETSASVVQGAPVPGTITVPVSNPVVAVGGGGGVIAAAAAVSGGGGGSGGGTTVIAPGPDLVQLDPNSDLKSPISLVHEIALKRSLTVSFEVVRESGPPHMRTFVTTCTVGELRTQGEGTGKKVSKKRAAELMLEELKKLPPISTAALTRVKRKPSAKKKSRNLIKVGREEQKAAPEYGQGINPISRLIQIQQAKKEKEPVYTLLAERGVPRRREFVMQVAVGPTTAQGSGPNKKLAKRAAAESMLQLLGYSRPQPQPAKPAIKMDGSHSDPDKTRKQVTFLEENDGSRVSVNDSSQASAIQLQSIPPGSGRQLVPGLIMMQDGSALHGYQQMQASNMSAVVNMNQMVNMQATAAIAKELLESGSSPTAKALSKGQTNGSQPTSKPHLGNHQMGTGVQPPLAHQQPAVVPPPQQPMQPHMNHQPMMQTAPSPQIQSNPQSSQTQQNNSHAQIQSAANVAMTVPTNDNDGTNTSNNANLASNNNSTNNNINSTMTTNKLRGGALTISGNTSGQAFRPKDQLMYLANILNLQVQFTDFPKGSKNKSEFLSLVSLSTSPPHVSHGAGPTTEASHDQACLTALKALAEMGLDTVTSGNASKAT